jgi:hypothetical protein
LWRLLDERDLDACNRVFVLSILVQPSHDLSHGLRRRFLLGKESFPDFVRRTLVEIRELGRLGWSR